MALTGFRYIPNPAAALELERSLEMTVTLRETAERIAGIARDIAPVDTGAYRDSIHVEDGDEGVEVVAGGDEVDYALDLEFGTSDTPTFATLRQATEAAGAA